MICLDSIAKLYFILWLGSLGAGKMARYERLGEEGIYHNDSNPLNFMEKGVQCLSSPFEKGLETRSKPRRFSKPMENLTRIIRCKSLRVTVNMSSCRLQGRIYLIDFGFSKDISKVKSTDMGPNPNMVLFCLLRLS
jgi:hypothetical protein